MQDPNVRYANSNAALLHLLDNKSQLVSTNNYQSPSLKMKSKNGKDSSSSERPKSNKMRYADLSGTMRLTKNQLDTSDKRYTPVVSEKKGGFNMTFHNLSKVSSKEHLKIADIYKARETPPKKTPLTAKKSSDKVQERLTFYQQLQPKSQKKPEKQSLEYSNYPTSRQNSRVFGGQEENIETIDKRVVLKNNLMSQREFAELLTDVKNLPYIIKGMTKYLPNKSKNHGHPFSNNSSFYNHDEEKLKQQEQQNVDEKRMKLNQEDYSKVVQQRDAESAKKHRRGYSMGQTPAQPDKNLNLELEKHLQMEKQLQYQLQQQSINQQNNAQQQYQQYYPQQQMPQQMVIVDPQQEQDEYYAQFFNTNKLTFDFERLTVSQRGGKNGGNSTPVGSPSSKKGHNRTSSMEDLKSGARWNQKRASVGDQPLYNDRQNSELVELINMMDNPEEKAEFVQYIQDRQNFEQVMSLLESRYRNERNQSAQK
jgi:hypothetical protein